MAGRVLLLMLITSIALAANHGQIFRDLDKHLKSKISKHTQYGMLYICGKNVQYLPSEDREKLKEVEASNKGKKILMYPIKRMDDVFSNYFITQPQYLKSKKGGHVNHTEEILTKVVAPSMVNWMDSKNMNTDVIFLYTYLYPCEYCYDHIELFVKNWKQDIILGYTNETKLIETVKQKLESLKQSHTHFSIIRVDEIIHDEL